MSKTLASSCLRRASHVLKSATPIISQQTKNVASRTIASSRTTSSSLRRQLHTTRPTRAFAPITPQSLGQAAPPKQYKRSIKWGRRLLFVSAITGTIYLVDTKFYASSLTRTARTFATGIVVAFDYKLNFRPNPLFGGDITDLHNRSATRMFELLHKNGGLYLKIGQAIAMQSAILPPEFQKMFAQMFDDAPQNDWKDVEKVIREDFGKSPEEVFGVSFTGEPGMGVMEKRARASASVAQVHWARLADGREVAIKVQKREIEQQVDWDIWAFKAVSKIYSWWFDLPLYSLIPYVTERLKLETNFINEANNSEKMKALVDNEPRLKGRVYIPEVYRDLSSRRIMTAEFVEGVRLWDKETLTSPWYGGSGKGSPGAGGTPLDPLPTSVTNNSTSYNHIKADRNEWKGRSGKGGLGLSLKEVMTTMIDLFSAQMFLFGTVHCDPHPGNIFIRRLPNGHPELVLIDHGLYVNMRPELRHQYCAFWKAIMTFDNKTIEDITLKWGIKAPDLFASATLLRPYTGGDGSTMERVTGELTGKTPSERHYEVQNRLRQGIRDVLSEEEKFPQELMFIGRNMRIVQGNNQFLGSPVNRIKLTGFWASRSLAEAKDIDWRQRWTNAWRHVLFRFVLFGTDVAFWTARVRQKLGWGGGLEDDLEKQMRFIAKDQFGFELQHDVFEG